MTKCKGAIFYANPVFGNMLRIGMCIIQRVNNNEDLKQEAPMMVNEIRTSIKTIYRMLWEVLALYERTECYNQLPEDEQDVDIWSFMGDKLSNIRKEISTLFLGNKELSEKLNQIVDETERFVRSYEVPGVVKRWKQINPQLLFFDCVFDLLEECPEMFRKISWGITELKLSCYPDETLVEAKNSYFTNAKRKIEERNLRYSDKRVFQDELLRTLTLMFEHDFKEYLAG